MRRRITDAWAKLGTLTPAAGWGAIGGQRLLAMDHRVWPG